jgi:hypothetical protein
MTMRNEKFEELLSAELARQLEPQRGKAATAFVAHLAAEAAERQAAERAAEEVAGGSKSQVHWARGEVSKRAMWVWMSVPSLIAACLAVVVTLHFVGGTLDQGSTTNIVQNGVTGNGGNSALFGPRAVEGVGTGSMASQTEITQPGGVVIQNNQPMREIHQQQVIEKEWQDPDNHARYHVTEQSPEKVTPVPTSPY